ncbi:MAG: hypothetical protein ACR2KB_18165, partial [Chitinophagaceae bacterium]
YFLWQCQKVHKRILCLQRKSFLFIKHTDVTFFACPKKVTKKKAGRFNTDQSQKLTTQAYESSGATV